MAEAVKNLRFIHILSTFTEIDEFSIKSGLKFDVVLSIADVFTLVFIAFPVDPVLTVVAHIDYRCVTFLRGYFYWDY